MSLHEIRYRGSNSYAEGDAGRMKFNDTVNGIRITVQEVKEKYKSFEDGKATEIKVNTAPITPVGPSSSKPLEEMSIGELHEVAKAKGIKVHHAAKEKSIIKKINEA